MGERDLHRPVTSQRESGIREALSQAQKLLGDLTSSPQLGPKRMVGPESPENFRDIGRLADLLAQLSGSCVHVSHFRSRIALGRNQWHSQRELKAEFLLGAIGSLGQSFNQFQSSAREYHRLPIRESPDGVVSSLLQILRCPSEVSAALKVHR